jgi:hypothetical protein
MALIKVELPDHPYTFDGPDQLISDRGSLIGVFRLRDGETDQPKKLLSRISNSLIVYPAYTKMVLLLNPKQNVSNAITLFAKDYVSEVIEKKDLNNPNSLLRDKKDESKLKELKDVQRRIFSSQARIQTNNINYFSENPIKKSRIERLTVSMKKARYVNPVSRESTITKANIYEYDQQVYGFKKLNNRRSDILDLRPYYEFSIFSDFKIDSGVPHFYKISHKLLNVDSMPSAKLDPLKPMRIASLFGWYFVNASSEEEIQHRRTIINSEF